MRNVVDHITDVDSRVACHRLDEPIVLADEDVDTSDCRAVGVDSSSTGSGMSGQLLRARRANQLPSWNR
jgi:hypothetical protein